MATLIAGRQINPDQTGMNTLLSLIKELDKQRADLALRVKTLETSGVGGSTWPAYDGGDSATTVWTDTVSGGDSATVIFDITIDGGSVNG
jgi:hypothetical protein